MSHYQGVAADRIVDAFRPSLRPSPWCCGICKCNICHHQLPSGLLVYNHLRMQHMQDGGQHDLANAACSCDKQDGMPLHRYGICCGCLPHCTKLVPICTHMHCYMLQQKFSCVETWCPLLASGLLYAANTCMQYVGADEPAKQSSPGWVGCFCLQLRV